jgi:hypothetical protein
MYQLGNLGQLAAGFLDGLNVGRGFCEAEHSLGIEI